MKKSSERNVTLIKIESGEEQSFVAATQLFSDEFQVFSRASALLVYPFHKWHCTFLKTVVGSR